MRFLSKVLAALSLAFAVAGAQAQSPTGTFSNLWWSFSASSGSGFSDCNLLNMDVTGDWSNSDNFAGYGQLLCSGGSYAVDGSLYFASSTSNIFHVTVGLGPAHKLVCLNMNTTTLDGSCTIYTNLGTQTGTAFIDF